jgi:hypothetical protein
MYMNSKTLILKNMPHKVIHRCILVICNIINLKWAGHVAGIKKNINVYITEEKTLGRKITSK